MMTDRAQAADASRKCAFEILHSAGWSDFRIASALQVGAHVIKRWRQDRNLEPNAGRVRKINETIAREMLAGGATDKGMAETFGVDPSAIAHWRKRRGLSASFPASRISAEDRRTVNKHLKLGASRKQICDLTSIKSLNTIDGFRSKIKSGKLRRTGITNETIRRRVSKDPNVQKRIDRAIGAHVPADIRADAAMDLYVDLLEGRVDVDLIEKVAPSYRSRAFDMCGSKFGARSLDEDLGDGWSLMDTIQDECAQSDMEAAAEDAWENR